MILLAKLILCLVFAWMVYIQFEDVTPADDVIKVLKLMIFLFGGVYLVTTLFSGERMGSKERAMIAAKQAEQKRQDEQNRYRLPSWETFWGRINAHNKNCGLLPPYEPGCMRGQEREPPNKDVEATERRELQKKQNSAQRRAAAARKKVRQAKPVYRASFDTYYFGKTARGYINIYKDRLAYDIQSGSLIPSMDIGFGRIRNIKCSGEKIVFLTNEQRKNKFYINKIGGGAPKLYQEFTDSIRRWRRRNCQSGSCGELIVSDGRPQRRYDSRTNTMQAPNITGWQDHPTFGGGQCR